MEQEFKVTNALCISCYDLDALLQGRSITIMSSILLARGKIISLCSVDATPRELSLENSYNSTVLPHLSNQLGSGKICAWAEIRFCKAYTITDLEALQALTPWTSELLKWIIKKESKIFIACVRVYPLPSLLNATTDSLDRKIGKFIGIPHKLTVKKTNPIIQDVAFEKILNNLQNLTPPKSNVLEDLKTEIYNLIPHIPNANSLFQDLDYYLNWNLQPFTTGYPEHLNWIQDIGKVANSSDGHTFEKLVRKAMILLGFENTVNTGLNPDMTGGAGGLDVCCNKPYWVIGECKATQHDKVPTDTPAQLVYLGLKDLEYEDYEQSIKIIFPAGDFTNAARKIAEKVKMNVMRPETLRKLLDLKVKYPGSINLAELKEVLEASPFGLSSDQKINDFIDQINIRISLRAKIVASVKFLQGQDSEKMGFDASQIRIHYITSNPNRPIQEEEVKNILIELSSPLAGYLGHTTTDGIDRFYYLRDLPQPYTPTPEP